MMSARLFVCAFLAACAGAQAPTAAVAAPELVWEVENRFRFYRDAEVFKTYAREALAAGNFASANWVSKTERRLQDNFVHGAWEGWAERWRNSTCWDRQNFKFAAKKYADRCHDYPTPASHRVILSVQDSPVNATCAWTVTRFGTEKSSRPDFVEKRAAPPPGSACRNVPVEVPYAVSGGAGVKVSVSVTDGNVTTNLPEQTIVVSDLLVLGMGDSFGAGVGNPDRPARLQQQYGLRYDGSFSRDGGKQNLPVRVGVIDNGNTSDVASAQGEWLDIRCFRSQYGPQLRSALHLAIGMRHTAITYIDLACDGARIIEGLLHRKALGGGFATKIAPPSQIEVASRLLCAGSGAVAVPYTLRPATGAAQCKNLKSDQICEFAKNGRLAYQQKEAITSTLMKVCKQAGDKPFQRPIDLVLLSIGGNDIGFAPMVGDAIMDDTRFVTMLGRLVGEIHDGQTGRQRLELLESKYRVLDSAITRYLPLRAGNKKPIFLTAYPIPVDDREGELCGTDQNAAAANAALDIDQTFASFAGKRTSKPREPSPISRLRDVVQTTCLLNLRRFGWFDGGPAAGDIVSELTKAGAICSGVNAAANEGAADKLNWQYVGEHLLSYRGHGFCARGANETAADALSVPKFVGVTHDDWWNPTFNSARPYGARQRWVRTPNDAFVVTNWHTQQGRLQQFLNLLSAATTSALHPTAEGYAAVADAVLARTRAYLCAERKEVVGTEPLCAAQ